MSSANQVTIATVNTRFGWAVRETGGLRAVASADILLLQELYAPAQYAVEERLEQIGFKTVGIGGHFGLAIALRNNSLLTYKQDTTREAILQRVNAVGASLTKRYSRQKSEYCDRGLLAAKFVTANGAELTIATTHLPVVTAPRKRAQFLTQLETELKDKYYGGPCILAGDMNHYPGPKTVDYAFRKAAQFYAVDIGEEITWPSKHAGFLESKLGRQYGGQFDDVLYRGQGLKVHETRVVDVLSDHRAVMAAFSVRGMR